MNKSTFKVLKFEIVRQLKKPSFWIVIFFIFVLICGGLIISIIAGTPAEPTSISEDTTIAITDEANILPEDNPFSLYSNKNDGIKAVKENKIDLYFYIPADFKDSKKIEFYHVSDDLGLFDESSNAIKSILANYVKNDISDVEVLALTGNFSVESNTFSSDGEESNALGKAIIPAIFLVAFFVFVCAFGNRMLMTVVEEKENRVSEMILTSVSSKHLIIGKILALLVLGAIQILALIIPIIIFVFVSDQNQAIASIINAIVIEPFSLIVCILLFLFSILLYAGSCTFVGAFTPTAKDASQFFGPIIIGLMLPLYFTQVFLTGEVNGLIEFLTYFPLSAPIALFLRFGVGSISTIGIIIGIIELFILAAIAIRAAIATFQKNAINFSIALPKFFKR